MTTHSQCIWFKNINHSFTAVEVFSKSQVPRSYVGRSTKTLIFQGCHSSQLGPLDHNGERNAQICRHNACKETNMIQETLHTVHYNTSIQKKKKKERAYAMNSASCFNQSS